MRPGSDAVYEFGPYRLEAGERRLSKSGHPVPLRAKVFDTLLMLVEHHGRLVHKNDLLAAVWPDATVEETNLSHNISELRRAFGEETGTQPYIETVSKSGYRFVAAVREIQSSVERPATVAARGQEVPKTRYALSGDVHVAYQVLGDGPIDVVFVPGWITHLEYGWQQPRVAHFFRGLAAFSRLILFDKRGTGLSDRVPEHPTLQDRMDDVRAVMVAVGSERAALFGMSEGGQMAMLFAATHPDRVLALAVYATFAKRVWSPDYPWAPTPEQRQRWMNLLEADWGGKTDLDTLAPSVSHDKEFIAWWGTYLRLGASPGAAQSLARFNTQTDVRAVLPAIAVPTLVLHRTGDRDVDVEEARYLASHIPAARLAELDGDDHLIYTGDADRIVDEVRAFFSQHSSVHVQAERILATVLSVAGMTSDLAGDAAALFDRTIAVYRGRRVHGEELEATFDGPERAIRCACVLVAAGAERGMALKAGVHTGECEMVGGRQSGVPFRMAAALAAGAREREVVVSRTVKDLVSGSRMQFENRGSRRVAGVAGSWDVYTAVLPEEPSRRLAPR
jgi:DNA-binding winged helix-turn-helix (wHTH) protein/alpha-beta hydrolase superfamily lysophospholipase